MSATASTGLPKIPSNRVRRFQKDLLHWFRSEGRHFSWRVPSATTYQIVVSEMLLQRTRADTVERFFPTFIAKFPSWKYLAEVPEPELQRFLEPIGLSRRRAAAFKALAREVISRNGRFPTVRSELEALPGIGQYIANAILLMAHGKREPLLDVNMARVLERYFGPRKLVDIRYDPYLQNLARRVTDHDSSKEINWAILDLAATVCTRRPHCESCPLKIRCRYARQASSERQDNARWPNHL